MISTLFLGTIFALKMEIVDLSPAQKWLHRIPKGVIKRLQRWVVYVEIRCTHRKFGYRFVLQDQLRQDELDFKVSIAS